MAIRTFIRVNERIRAREVRLIDADGKQVGVVPVIEALKMSRQRGLDLVEVAPDAQPPVCRILDFGKYRYEIAKRERESRKHQGGSKMKELQFHVNIDPHDFEIKVNHAREFLEKDMRVKCSLKFRGREMAHVELGKQVMERLIKSVDGVGRVDVPPQMMGRSIVMLIAPDKRAKKSGAGAPKPQPSAPVNPVLKDNIKLAPNAPPAGSAKPQA
jgi:translation initiation factor IF-3